MMLIQVGLWIVAALILFSMLAGVGRSNTKTRTERVLHVIIAGFILAIVVAAALTIGDTA